VVAIMEASISSTEQVFTDAREDRESNILAKLFDTLDSEPRDITIHEMMIQVWESMGESGKQIQNLVVMP
jgi:hypothetical protein